MPLKECTAGLRSEEDIHIHSKMSMIAHPLFFACADHPLWTMCVEVMETGVDSPQCVHWEGQTGAPRLQSTVTWARIMLCLCHWQWKRLPLVAQLQCYISDTWPTASSVYIMQNQWCSFTFAITYMYMHDTLYPKFSLLDLCIALAHLLFLIHMYYIYEGRK